MPVTTFLLVLLLLSFAGFQLGRTTAVSSAGGRLSRLHSVPSYYGLYVAMWVGLPALILFALWTGLEGIVVNNMVRASLPASIASLSAQEINLIMVDIHNLAYGNITSRVPDPALTAAAGYYNHLRGIGNGALARRHAGPGLRRSVLRQGPHPSETARRATRSSGSSTSS